MKLDLETIGYFLFMEEQERIEETRSRSIEEEEEEDQQEDNNK